MPEVTDRVKLDIRMDKVPARLKARFEEIIRQAAKNHRLNLKMEFTEKQGEGDQAWFGVKVTAPEEQAFRAETALTIPLDDWTTAPYTPSKPKP